jgi:peptidoglycan pentaglycine glycine transferase (the first glycine)
LKVIYLANNRRDEWDAFLAKEPSFALLQSWGWGDFKEKSGWKAFRVAVEEQGRIVAGAQILIKPLLSTLASVAYIPRGPFGNWLNEDMATILLSELHHIAQLHRAIFLKIEPPLLKNPTAVGLLEGLHFSSSFLTNQPSATIIMDLDMDNVMQQMRKRTCEYIRYSARNGVSVRIGGFEDLLEFTRIMRITAQREHFVPRTRAYYEDEWQTFSDLKQTVLLMAYYQDQLLAVHMAYRFGEHAAYFHGGSSKAFKELHPNSLLAWEAIKWAQSQGCKTYDLWGIPDEVGWAVSEGKEPPIPDRTDALWGVYHFKRGFSKNIVGYVGSWDYVYNPILYPLITNRFLNVETFDGFLALIDSLRTSWDVFLRDSPGKKE